MSSPTVANVRIVRMTEQARIAQRSGKSVQALAIFSHAYSLCDEETPDDGTRWLIHSGLGACYAQLGQPRQAAEEFHRALEIGRASHQDVLVIRSHSDLIELHYSQGRYGTALEHMREAIEVTDLRRRPLAEAFRTYGLDLYRCGDHLGAIESLEIASTLFPDKQWVNDLPLVETLVLACVESGRVDQARIHLDAVRSASTAAPDVMLLGLEALTELIGGDLDAVLELAARSETDSGDSLFDWVMAQANGHPGASDDVLERWVRTDTTAYNRRLRLEIARAFEAVGNYEQAYAFEVAASAGHAEASTTALSAVPAPPDARLRERVQVQLLAERDHTDRLVQRLAALTNPTLRRSEDATALLVALARHLDYLRAGSAALERTWGTPARRSDVSRMVDELRRRHLEQRTAS